MRLAYPVRLERHPVTVVATFPDVPEALTEGATEDEALAEAKDCLVAALGGYIQDGRPIPVPSQGCGMAEVALPELVAAKVALYEAARTRRLDASALAMRLWLLAACREAPLGCGLALASPRRRGCTG